MLSTISIISSAEILEPKERIPSLVALFPMHLLVIFNIFFAVSAFTNVQKRRFSFGKPAELWAKKKSTEGSKGFKPKVEVVDPEEVLIQDTQEQTVANVEKKSAAQMKREALEAKEDYADADAIFRKYRISNGENLPSIKSSKKKALPGAVEDETAPFGREVMANMSFEQQAKLDKLLVSAVFVALSFVILCGIAISFGAFRVVYPDIQISAELDSFITNFLDPAFTPALGVFFLFSITFGLFKFAQISNSQSVYKE